LFVAAGMMVGKALYEGILLNLSFAPFFIKCLQVRQGPGCGLSSLGWSSAANPPSVAHCSGQLLVQLLLSSSFR
jgi:hypothetical protein